MYNLYPEYNIEYRYRYRLIIVIKYVTKSHMINAAYIILVFGSLGIIPLLFSSLR